MVQSRRKIKIKRARALCPDYTILSIKCIPRDSERLDTRSTRETKVICETRKLSLECPFKAAIAHSNY